MTRRQKRQIELLEKIAKKKGMLIWQRDIEKENVEFIKNLTRKKPKPLDYKTTSKNYTWLYNYK